MLKCVRYLLVFGVLVLWSGSQLRAADEIKGLGFGVGLGFRWNVLRPDLVSDATVDANGIVRVNTRNNTQAGLLLEMHDFPWTFKGGEIGHGPFAAVQSGSDQVITAAGAGWMFGFKIKDNKAFGLGIGYAGLPSAKVLGAEFVDGQPAPKGPDGKPLTVRLQQRDKGSVLFVLSFVFNSL